MRLILLIALIAAFTADHDAAIAAGEGNAERGAYVLRLAGCATCHTAPKGGKFLAGGRELKSPFGSFFPPNITPDSDSGIGGWSDEDFVQALRHGKSPDGKPYYPAFPYTSYTRMTDRDMLDLKAYLDTIEPVRNQIPDHKLGFPFSVRSGMHVWRALFFDTNVPLPDPNQSEAWNRGAYIVNGPGHCQECHTPRNVFGALQRDRALSGNPKGPDNKPVPNITGHAKLGIKEWSIEDVVSFLQIGIKPDGDFAGGAMTDVIEDATGKLTDADVAAIAIYLKSLPAIPAE
ncbi:MAG: mono/diheme cytochrome c family protein [Alphaproteobacteria bacterium]|jgi:mono/diheme cytochrome c family protein